MLGPFTPSRYLAFIITALAGSFIYTWVLNGTRGSVFLVVLMHAASNAATQVLTPIILDQTLSDPWAQALGPDWLNIVAFVSAALLLLLLTRGRLAYKENLEPKRISVDG